MASLAANVCIGYKHIDQHRNQHDHEHETRATAGMPRHEFLGVVNADRLAGFEIENHLMLRSVILEDAEYPSFVKEGTENQRTG